MVAQRRQSQCPRSKAHPPFHRPLGSTCLNEWSTLRGTAYVSVVSSRSKSRLWHRPKRPYAWLKINSKTWRPRYGNWRGMRRRTGAKAPRTCDFLRSPWGAGDWKWQCSVSPSRPRSSCQSFPRRIMGARANTRSATSLCTRRCASLQRRYKRTGAFDGPMNSFVGERRRCTTSREDSESPNRTRINTVGWKLNPTANYPS
ncbi:hypothetical protein FB451DRAFT_476557 [Mycena latifolia]|nr:hypothetical protein FB451DRAFT_476557 [Mycena latifolia]